MSVRLLLEGTGLSGGFSLFSFSSQQQILPIVL